MATRKTSKLLLKDLNDVLVCTLCNGYLTDATILTECHHIFCRGCILKYFENCKTACPCCNLVYKKKNQNFFKSDPQLQAVVYKLVPGLYTKEMQRREDFYRSSGVRASSSCSDDSVLERERDMINEEQSLVSPVCGEKNLFFGPEDSISLSLEYYQVHLDTTLEEKIKNNNNISDKHKVNKCKSDKENKRFLQCPAAVSMGHLQKFVRMKYALSPHHKVDIIYGGEVLPAHFSLMDVAYTFQWKKLKPMRFFYRIFTPLKIQPIKIINTGGDKLQVVPTVPPVIVPPSTPIKVEEVKEETNNKECESEKERLLAHLQLQSKTKTTQQQQQNSENVVLHDFDDEEKKRFAEIRDREWALQKKLDDEKEKDDDYHHFSKKRKKNKHNKNNEFVYKKRKLHAEITNEEELKLKVKLTPHNGHKHKHHKNVDVSSKEKLLQMRQIRHKQVINNDQPINGNEEKTLNILNNRVTVQIERNEQTEQQAKKTLFKTYQNRSPTLERKIASLQQRCTIEATKTGKPNEPKPEEPPTRPSLEITLIEPPKPPAAKRPPPPTIPLDRIKKLGLSITPKPLASSIEKTIINTKCDNIGALDLSLEGSKVNGFGAAKVNSMSNLHMLSKVAAEHPKRPQMPNLQTLRIPTPNRVPPSLKMIDRSQFRFAQVRNQNIRNIPNPSLLVRQHQNRLNLVKEEAKPSEVKEAPV